MPRPLTVLLRAVALPSAAAVLVISTIATPDHAAARPDPGDPPAEQAEEALDAVEELIPEPVGDSGAAPQGKSGQPGQGADDDEPERDLDATMALRDLAGLVDELEPAERARAQRYLARPTDNNDQHGDSYASGTEPVRTCEPGMFCVHYVESTADKATAAFVDQVVETMKKVYRTYQRHGYRMPLGDGGAGVESLPDIYLADIGDRGVFGYASIDGAARKSGRHQGFPGYLVLDNDYARAQYGNSQTPRDFMKVTAAHEYFHLIQFGYDWWEDLWFMEATATWAENLVYPGIDDNRSYLRGRNSPLTNPRDSMDWGDTYGNPYGDWLFFEYVTQRWGVNLVRQMWRHADAWTNGGKRNPPDRFSTAAVRKVVTNQGTTWNAAFRRYVDANRRPGSFYREGGAYPKAKRHWGKKLRKNKPLRTPSVKLDHLSGASFRVKPANGMRRGWKLRIKVDGQPKWRGGSAIVTWRKRNGVVKRTGIGLGKNGVGKQRLPFNRNKIRWAEITVVNASTRFRNCNSETDLSCGGWSKDDNRRTDLRLKAVRR